MPEFTRVDNAALDVMPGVYPNAIRGSDTGDLQVALLGSETLDPTTVDLSTVVLTNPKGTGKVPAHGAETPRDVNGDGRIDAVFNFPIPALRDAGLLATESTRVLFDAKTQSGAGVSAQDGVYDASHVVVKLPAPTGPYALGTTEFTWTDSGREESFTQTSDDHRTLQVRLWYPARAMPQAQPATYFLHPVEGELLAAWQGFPAQMFGFYFAHAVRDAALPEGSERFPVVLFSPGYGTAPTIYSGAIEELTSQGYVVAAISHPYTGAPVVLPDGRVLPHTVEISPVDEAQNAHIQAVWTGDARFVLDQLEKLGAESSEGRFAGRLDFTRVGMFGHSFGGSTSADACRTDARFKAGLNLDGSFHGDLSVEVHAPFLMMNSEESALDPTRSAFFQKLRAMGYSATVHGTQHFSFSDIALALPLVRTYAPNVAGKDIQIGTLEGTRAFAVTAAYVRVFFDKHLRGNSSPLLDGPSAETPEVDFSVHRP
ncbi:hypothetical protein KRR26_32265 [Corallococcus sp. M34]|uniref:alpha/beta hydrolase family protein n=1 Tax=Citreicoccus inhibens TaxID=2849499 RepID=UPI001C241FC1|nr:hypothetical protein [Citreicoccus inhibens]MBU8900292.1 hypothetical protein [Citreicoccus inhibens]